MSEVSVTMSVEAAWRFYDALNYGSVVVARDDQAEWLRWGASRTIHALGRVIGEDAVKAGLQGRGDRTAALTGGET